MFRCFKDRFSDLIKEVPAPPSSTDPPKSSKSQKDGSKTLSSVEGGVNSKSCDVKNNGLSVTEIQILDDKQEADRIFAQYKNRKRLFKSNLIIEGTCNYFFWIDKIALVSVFLV